MKINKILKTTLGIWQKVEKALIQTQYNEQLEWKKTCSHLHLVYMCSLILKCIVGYSKYTQKMFRHKKIQSSCTLIFRM